MSDITVGYSGRNGKAPVWAKRTRQWCIIPRRVEFDQCSAVWGALPAMTDIAWVVEQESRFLIVYPP